MGVADVTLAGAACRLCSADHVPLHCRLTNLGLGKLHNFIPTHLKVYVSKK